MRHRRYMGPFVAHPFGVRCLWHRFGSAALCPTYCAGSKAPEKQGGSRASALRGGRFVNRPYGQAAATRQSKIPNPKSQIASTLPYRANSAKLSGAAVNEVERSTTRLKRPFVAVGW